jgi:drug/metabolite transporter (DMT)-like permease
LLGLVTQVYRYRRVSSPVQRQQTKWVFLGFATVVLAIFSWSIVVEIFPLPAGPVRLLFNTVGVGFLAIVLLFFPLSFFFFHHPLPAMGYRPGDSPHAAVRFPDRVAAPGLLR